jgi:hypothetical protein
MQIPAHKIKFLAAALLILGCTLDPTDSFNVDTNTTFDLGEVPQSTRIVSVDIDALTKTTITLNMDVTIGAMYTIHLLHPLGGDPLAVTGFTATTQLVTVELDYSTISDGLYDIVLIDTQGNSTRIPILLER